MDTHGKTAAQLELEVAEQRERLERRVAELQQRMSAGRIVDEVLNYAKSSGGNDFVTNLGRSVRVNPMPVALTGIGLAWLMTRANSNSAINSRSAADDQGDWASSSEQGERYPFARVRGASLRRIRQASDDGGQRFSEFTDEAGARFKARTDDLGGRAGHFADETGALYRGFVDEAGNRVREFLDEAGNRIGDAQGWTSDRWEGASERLSNIGDTVTNRVGLVADRAAELRRRASGAGSRLQSNAGSAGKTMVDLLQQQPLIAGALAFAVGAALAAALPPTRREDRLIGAPADQLKARGARAAGAAYEEGRERVADALEQARGEAGSIYSRAKEELASDTGAEDKGRLH
ncbi:MAG TPA: DUF3618 domain-containing protein [Devosiaceae bacterium]|nr:DUF3618 domain-containing protein [Devosiaceae bacterium]